MSDKLKKELEIVINRQLSRIDSSAEILHKEIASNPEIMSAIEKSSTDLKNALAVIIEAIDTDYASQDIATENKDIPVTNNQHDVSLNSYQAPEVIEEPVEATAPIIEQIAEPIIEPEPQTKAAEPALTIEEIQRRQRENSPSFSEALVGEVPNQADEPISVESVSQEPEAPITAEPIIEPKTQAAPEAAETIEEIIEEEEMELSPFAKMQEEVETEEANDGTMH